jgi:MFS family permease
MTVKSQTTIPGSFYGPFLLFIAGMGGLLYGIDVGIIAAALLYLGKTVNLTVGQTSVIVAAVLGGGMLSSLVAGFLADWLGRKTMMVVSAVMFIASVGLIVLSQGFVPLFLGRLLQGMSGGVIAVVVPLYLAECLSARTRGRGSAIFQLMLTVGIVIAAAVGWYFTQHAETAIAAAAGNPAAIGAAADHAWRGMFLSVIYPGVIFFLGSLFLNETPRWLFRRGRKEAALAALLRTSSEEEATLQMQEMEALSTKNEEKRTAGTPGSLIQRKYVVPFVLACIVLACNQATGINSILSYLVIILKQAGMSADHATQGDVAVKLINCLMTIVAVFLVDRKGRKFLLTLGTAGIMISLCCASFLFHGFEAKRVDVKSQVQQKIQANMLAVPLSQIESRAANVASPMVLTVAYTYGSGDKIATILSTDADNTLKIVPDDPKTSGILTIEHASYGPVPSKRTGWLIGICIALFIASFAIGPGVVVWLMLSELMPTRIRSGGMGIALLINQGVSTLIAGVFLPVVGRYGYFAMFLFWALCTVVYFCTAVFFLPETKGKTLEEIELGFEGATAGEA